MSEKRNADLSVKFVFAGKIAGSAATGRTRAKYRNSMFKVDSGTIQWEAKAVSWKRYEQFVGIGIALIQRRGVVEPLFRR